MQIKIEKINELESLGFRKMRPYSGKLCYAYDFNDTRYDGYRASIRVNAETGFMNIKILKPNTFDLIIPEIFKVLIEKGFIE